MIEFARSRPILAAMIEKADVVAVGPGLGQSDDIRQLVRFLIAETDRPLVIDADGLNALVGQTELLADLERPVVLTPHPGEFARLIGKAVADVQADRVRHAAELAATVRGAYRGAEGLGTGRDRRQDVISSTPPGNPGMATGGIGRRAHRRDRRPDRPEAVPRSRRPSSASFVHGLAGDIARDHHGEVGMIAGDIVDALPDAFAHLMPDPDLIALNGRSRARPAHPARWAGRLRRRSDPEDRSSGCPRTKVDLNGLFVRSSVA